MTPRQELQQHSVELHGGGEDERLEAGPPVLQNAAKRRLDEAVRQAFRTAGAHLGLSRLARYASANGIDPADVDDGTIEAFIATVRAETLHRNPNALHRKVAQIWNEAAACSSGALQSVHVPSFKRPPQRVDWSTLPESLRADVDHYLKWCLGTDMSRPRADRGPWRRERFSCVVTRSMRP